MTRSVVSRRMSRSIVPVFPGYLFFLGTDEQRYLALTTNRIANILPVPNQQQLVTYKDVTRNIEIQADDNMRVRTLLLPVEYDEKGRPRKLTEKEKKALKGPDATQPGYLADFDSLKPGQEVKVFLAKSKDAHKAKGKDAADSKEKPKATTILIVSEPAK